MWISSGVAGVKVSKKLTVLCEKKRIGFMPVGLDRDKALAKEFTVR